MKKQPHKTKQWAEETYNSLEFAWGLLREESPNANEYEKLELVRFAPAIAGMNRGISNKEEVETCR